MPFTPPDPNSRTEFGNQSATQVALASKGSLVLASYNIRYAVGRYLIASGLLRKVGYNLPRNRERAIKHNIATAARAFSENELLPAPDILALQEADQRTRRAGEQHVAALLAGELSMSYVHAGAGLPRGIKPRQREWWLDFEEQVATDDQGDMGVALLSRVPLHDLALLDLPWHECPWRPRLAVAATIHWREGAVRLFNVHIDPHGPLDNQHEQTEAVLREAETHEGPVIIFGDFNTLSKQKAIEIRKLMELHGYTTPFPTDIPTWRGAGVVRFHADWIFGRGLKFIRWGVAKPLNVSDHWPIWAEMRLIESV
jgi:endonuclease/exonuclease/phosphatase family metal-dependent hydrolase